MPDGYLPHDVIDVSGTAALTAHDDAMREHVDGAALEICRNGVIATIEHRDRHRHPEPHERRSRAWWRKARRVLSHRGHDVDGVALHRLRDVNRGEKLLPREEL